MNIFCQNAKMSSEGIETEKQKAIAEAAFQVFAEHGFRKTSMRLIALKAGMSRPALYLHFQSKEDVFIYLSISYFTNVATHIDEVLTRSGSPEAVLNDVFDAFDPDGVMALLLDAEHGDELMEAKSGLAHEAVDDIATGIRLSLTDWLKREAELGRIDCDDPDITGQTIMSSYYGLKTPAPSYEIYKARTKQLAKLLGAGLKS